jgi:hypothetical protein
MNDYTKGILTGASLILCFFMFVSAKSQIKNLGDISVTKLTVVNEDGLEVGRFESFEDNGVLTLTKSGKVIGTGSSVILMTGKEGATISTYNDNGKETVYLGTGEGGNGFLTTNNADGKETVFLGTGEGGVGFLSTSNADGKKTAYLGTSEDGNGFLTTSNADGKKTAFLGTGKDGGGKLHTYNKHGVMTGGFGTNTENDGIAVLYDRYGDIGWSASGKQ